MNRACFAHISKLQMHELYLGIFNDNHGQPYTTPGHRRTIRFKDVAGIPTRATVIAIAVVTRTCDTTCRLVQTQIASNRSVKSISAEERASESLARREPWKSTLGSRYSRSSRLDLEIRAGLLSVLISVCAVLLRSVVRICDVYIYR